jgi:beta-galactosidase
VKKGGIFITTYFTGLIDESVGVYLGGYPGPLKDVMGIKVEEYNPLPLGGKNIMNTTDAMNGFKKQYDCSVWCDVIHTTGAKVLATFVNDYYAGSPCLTENQFGKGKAYYVGTRPNSDFMKDFFTKILKEQGVSLPCLPKEVELITRTKNSRPYHFYLNHGEAEKTVKLPPGKYEDILTGDIYKDTLTLGKYGVYILNVK